MVCCGDQARVTSNCSFSGRDGRLPSSLKPLTVRALAYTVQIEVSVHGLSEESLMFSVEPVNGR